MKLGYSLRRTMTKTLEIARGSLDLAFWLYWALFDFSKFKKIEKGKIKSLLVIYGGSIGDVYNAIGLMNAVTKKYPKLKISFVTYKKNYTHVKNPGINLISLTEARKKMRNGVYDGLVLLQGTIDKKEFFPKGMRKDIRNIPYRSSCDNLHIEFFYKQFPPALTRRVLSIESNGFEDQSLAFQKLGIEVYWPEYHYTKDGEEFAKRFYKKNKLNDYGKVIFMHVGGGSILAALKELKEHPELTADPTHKWPASRWAIVADKLIKKYDATIIFTGVGEEKVLVKEVIDKMKHRDKTFNLVDKTTIDQSSSILKRGDLLITIDTGTMHIAAQTGIPVMGLFSSFKPGSTSAMSKNKIDIYHPETCTACRRYALCPEGKNLCMRKISIDEILNASDTLLRSKKQ
jgi:ADP-heptose:LPS heptosyltransferase